MNPFFSVIIPTTGGRLENLELVLTSLACQQFPRQLFEVIVVNDGGEEEALDVVEGFVQSFSRLTYILTKKFTPLDFDQPLDAITQDMMDGKSQLVYFSDWCRGKLVEGNEDDDMIIPNVQPRNQGAGIADADFFIFADSDIILSPNALSCYYQDMMENPERIVLGVYHWLTPMHVTPNDVTTRFNAIIEQRLAKKLLTEVEPDGKQTHNICRDMRMKDFLAHQPNDVLTRPGHINVALACYSGNICWPRHMFEAIGGYDPHLHAGAHEDGTSGLDAYKAGFGISFDNRIIGGHLYHHRNIEYIESFKWPEIDYINAKHADLEEMKGIIETSEEEKKRLGIDTWKEEGKLGW